MFFLFPRLEHPAGWICARYKSLLLLLLLSSRQALYSVQCMQSIAHNASSRMRSMTAFAQDVGQKTTDRFTRGVY